LAHRAGIQVHLDEIRVTHHVVTAFESVCRTTPSQAVPFLRVVVVKVAS
jgi:hypothetical protein